MLTRTYLGKALTHRRIVPGNTATAFGSDFYIYTERTVAYTSGGTTEITAGQWIVGATSTARAQVVSITLASGTWAGGDAAGVITVRSQNGTFQSENLNVAGNGNLATIAANTVARNDNYENKGREAKACLVTVLAQTALVNTDGGTPDQTALCGIPIAAGQSYILYSIDEMKNFKVIDYTASSASTVNATFYF